MPSKTPMSPIRRLLGPAAMIAASGGFLAIAIHERVSGIPWELIAFSGAVALAGVGLSRRSMTMQLLSRAMAWLVLVPSAMVGTLSLVSGHTEWAAAAFAAASGGALLLARPMLHTADAHAQFAPSAFRSWLLAGATASAAAGLLTGAAGLDSFHFHSGFPAAALGLVALGVSLLASAVGVIRMRAWGILLGAATSMVTVLAALWHHDAAGFALALAAIPGFMLLLPVLIAKRDRAKAEAASFTRVSAYVGHEEPARIRVAADSSDAHDALFDDESDAGERRAEAAPPAARAQA